MKFTLRAWRMDDQAGLCRLCNEADRRYLSDRMPFPYTMEDAKQFIKNAMAQDGQTAVFRVICVDEEVIGNISVEQMDDINGKDAYIGYLLDRAYWGKGIMSEAVAQIIALAFERLDIHRITARTFDANLASRRLLEKNGFVLEGVLKEALYRNDRYYDDCIYGKLRESVANNQK